MTLSTDTPEAIREGRERHGLQAMMLSDHDLDVVDRFGLRDPEVELVPPGLNGLPMPTTLLVDADGNVVWKDQADDFQQRSEADYALRALRAHLA